MKEVIQLVWMLSMVTVLYRAEFSLSAYKRNKRKMELAEKMDTGHNQRKKRRQSSETVSVVLSAET